VDWLSGQRRTAAGAAHGLKMLVDKSLAQQIPQIRAKVST
jgi:hypothetical protein